VTSSSNPSLFGQVVTFTATVSPLAPGMGMPTGMVTFTIDNQVAFTPTLTNGAALISTSLLAGGTHTITVAYGGDLNFNPSAGSLAPTQLVVSHFAYLPLLQR
jgi:large repetitive protein